MGKVEQNKLVKRDKLMAAALELFTTKGITQTSIADITEKSGLGKGTFYQYFKDKYDLKEKLVVDNAEILLNHAVVNSGYEKYDRTDDKIIAIVNNVLNEFNENKIWLRFINKNLSNGIFKDAIEKEYSPCYQFFKDMIGIEDQKELSILIYTIVEFVGSVCYRVILYDDPVSLDEYRPYLEQCIRLIVNNYIHE